LLFDIKEAQELHCAQLKHNYEIERSNSVIKYFIQNNYNYTSILKPKQCDIKNKDIDNSNDSSLYLNSDDLTCKTQNKKYCFFNTLSTFVINSKVKCDS